MNTQFQHNHDESHRLVGSRFDEPSNAKHRPRRSARARREQQLRSDSRMFTRLVAGLYSVDTHRGSKLNKIGKILSDAFSGPTVKSAPCSSSYMPICRHHVQSKCTFGSSCRFSHDISQYENIWQEYPQDHSYSYQDTRRDAMLEQQLAHPTSMNPVNIEPTASDKYVADIIEPTSMEPTSIEPTVSGKYAADSIEPTSMEPTSIESTVSYHIEPTVSENYRADSIEPTRIESTSGEPTLSDKHGTSNHIEPSLSDKAAGSCSNILDGDIEPDSTLDHQNPVVANTGSTSNIFVEGITPVSTSAHLNPCNFLQRSRRAKCIRQLDKGGFGTVPSPTLGKRLRGKQTWTPITPEKVAQELAALQSMQLDKSYRITSKSIPATWKPHGKAYDANSPAKAELKLAAQSLYQETDFAHTTMEEFRLALESHFSLAYDALKTWSDEIKALAVSIVTGANSQPCRKRPSSNTSGSLTM